jgi:hypothetical protein
MVTECEGYDSEDDEVGSASKIWTCQSLLKGRSENVLPVSLSNLREKAIEKKKSWYPMVIKRVMAR